MTTPLDRPLPHKVQAGEALYPPTFDPAGLELVEYGRRNGLSRGWVGLANGDAALAAVVQDASMQGQR